MSDRADLHHALRRAIDPIGLMQRVAEEVLQLVSRAEGALVGLTIPADVLTYVCGSGYLAGRLGRPVPLDSSLVGLAVRTGETLRCDDTAVDDRVDRASCTAYGVVSCVCVPLWRHSDAIGVLTVSSSRRNAFDDGDVRTLTKLASFVSVVIGAAEDMSGVTKALLSPATLGTGEGGDDDLVAEERFVANVLSPGTLGRLEARHRVEHVLETRDFGHQYQPIFDLWNGTLFAVEALARFKGRPTRPPDQWFSEAQDVGLGIDLELASLEGALASLLELPSDLSVCVNLGPEALASGEAVQLLLESEPSRIIVELTEQVRVDDYPRLDTAIRRLRRHGARLAIDDTGAGFSSLAHILKLAPDVIKLDRALTTGIDADPVRRALASALVTFAGQTRSEIVAEGIETEGELSMLSELGIRFGQGYFLGRPCPLGSLRWKPAHTVPAGQLAGVSEALSEAAAGMLAARVKGS